MNSNLIIILIILINILFITEANNNNNNNNLPTYPNQLLPQGNRTVLAITNTKYGLQIVALGKDWYLYQKYQLANGSWSNWTMIPHPKDMHFESDPACAANVDGRVECCLRGHSTLALWCFHQTDASDPTSWSKGDQLMMGNKYTFPTNNVNLMLDSTGRLNIYLRGFDGLLYTSKQVEPGSSTKWTPVVWVEPQVLME